MGTDPDKSNRTAANRRLGAMAIAAGLAVATGAPLIATPHQVAFADSFNTIPDSALVPSTGNVATTATQAQDTYTDGQLSTTVLTERVDFTGAQSANGAYLRVTYTFRNTGSGLVNPSLELYGLDSSALTIRYRGQTLTGATFTGSNSVSDPNWEKLTSTGLAPVKTGNNYDASKTPGISKSTPWVVSIAGPITAFQRPVGLRFAANNLLEGYNSVFDFTGETYRSQIATTPSAATGYSTQHYGPNTLTVAAARRHANGLDDKWQKAKSAVATFKGITASDYDEAFASAATLDDLLTVVRKAAVAAVNASEASDKAKSAALEAIQNVPASTSSDEDLRKLTVLALDPSSALGPIVPTTPTSTLDLTSIQQTVDSINQDWATMAQTSASSDVDNLIASLTAKVDKLHSLVGTAGSQYTQLYAAELQILQIASLNKENIDGWDNLQYSYNLTDATDAYVQLFKASSKASTTVRTAPNNFSEKNSDAAKLFDASWKAASTVVQQMNDRTSLAIKFFDLYYPPLDEPIVITPPIQGGGDPTTGQEVPGSTSPDTTAPSSQEPGTPGTTDPSSPDPSTPVTPEDTQAHKDIAAQSDALANVVGDFNTALGSVKGGNESQDYTAVTNGKATVVEQAKALADKAAASGDGVVAKNAKKVAEAAELIAEHAETVFAARNALSQAKVDEYAQFWDNIFKINQAFVNSAYSDMDSTLKNNGSTSYTASAAKSLEQAVDSVNNFASTVTAATDLPSRESFDIRKAAQDSLENMNSVASRVLSDDASTRHDIVTMLDNGAAATRAAAILLEREGKRDQYVIDLSNAADNLRAAATAYSVAKDAQQQLNTPGISATDAVAAGAKLTEAQNSAASALDTINGLFAKYAGDTVIGSSRKLVADLKAQVDSIVADGTKKVDSIRNSALTTSAGTVSSTAGKALEATTAEDAKKAAEAAQKAAGEAAEAAKAINTDDAKNLATALQGAADAASAYATALGAREALNGLHDPVEAQKQVQIAADAKTKAANALASAQVASINIASNTEAASQAADALAAAASLSTKTSTVYEDVVKTAAAIKTNYDALIAAQAKAKEVVDASRLSIPAKEESREVIDKATEPTTVKTEVTLVQAKDNALGILEDKGKDWSYARKQDVRNQIESADSVEAVNKVLGDNNLVDANTNPYTKEDAVQDPNKQDNPTPSASGSSYSPWKIILIAILGLLGIGGGIVAYLQQTGQLRF